MQRLIEAKQKQDPRGELPMLSILTVGQSARRYVYFTRTLSNVRLHSGLCMSGAVRKVQHGRGPCHRRTSHNLLSSHCKPVYQALAWHMTKTSDTLACVRIVNESEPCCAPRPQTWLRHPGLTTSNAQGGRCSRARQLLSSCR